MGYVRETDSGRKINIAQEIENTPKKVINAPHETSLSRLDEVEAARHPDLRWSVN